MTSLQIIGMTCAYGVVLVVAIYFTRAPSQRIVAALAGGFAAGCFGVAAVVCGQQLGVWRVSIAPTPLALVLFYLGLSISCSPIYLVTWRIARRFGAKGLAVCLIVVGIIGPPRDYFYAATFPEWMVFGPGVAPVIADAAAYVGIVALGHYVMSLVGGAARGSRLR